ncbi:MAG: oligosaccharide flippase family protein [Methylococcaceae bacterium]|nr:oligosaccharide flippase family protein [Methylococcaceae bacterium]
MQSSQKNIKKRAIKAGVWIIAGHLLTQCIRFGGNLILTRLLMPEVFGVMAVVNVIIFGIGMFSDIGLNQNIIRSKNGEEPTFLNTAWTVQIIRGFSIGLMILIASAGFYQAGKFGFIPTTMAYADKDLPFLLAFLSLGSFISSFNSIYLFLLNRRLMLGKSIFIEITSQIAGLAVIIYIAWEYRTVYALVSGSVFSAFTKMLLSHLVIRDKCRFAWNKEAITEIANFGKWIMISSILGFMLAQGDRLILGMLITPDLLGVYSVAFFLANAVKDILNKLLSSVFFPVISETIRERPERLKDIYYKIRHRVDAIAMFCAGFLFTTGNKIVELLYDDRYHEAGWMLQILGLSMCSIGFTLAGQCFLANGRSSIVTMLIGIQTVALYVGLPLAFMHYGLTGAIWMIAATPVIRLIISGIFRKYSFSSTSLKNSLCYPCCF